MKEDIIRSAGNLQVCAGHESDCEPTIHAMSQIFNEKDSEAVLLIDASNEYWRLVYPPLREDIIFDLEESTLENLDLPLF